MVVNASIADRRVLWYSTLISAALHLWLGVAILRNEDWTDRLFGGRALAEFARAEPAEDPPILIAETVIEIPEEEPPPPPPPLRLGIEASDAKTKTWLGFAEGEEHLVPVASEVEQAALTPNDVGGMAAGIPDASGMEPAPEPAQPAVIASAVQTPPAPAIPPAPDSDPASNLSAGPQPATSPAPESSAPSPPTPNPDAPVPPPESTPPTDIVPPSELPPGEARSKAQGEESKPEEVAPVTPPVTPPQDPQREFQPETRPDTEPQPVAEPTPPADAESSDAETPQVEPREVEPPQAEPKQGEAEDQREAPPADAAAEREPAIPDPTESVPEGEREPGEATATRPVTPAPAVPPAPPVETSPEPPSEATTDGAPIPDFAAQPGTEIPKPETTEEKPAEPAASPEQRRGDAPESPTQPAPDPSIPTPAPSSVILAPTPEPAPGPAPGPTTGSGAAPGVGEGEALRRGIRSDKESPAAALKRAVKYRPGRPLAVQGLEVRTVEPRFPVAVRLTSSPRNPVVTIHFDRRGVVTRAEFLKDEEKKIVYSTGTPAMDEPLLTAIYQWRAKGRELEQLPADDPNATVSFVMEIFLRN